MNELFEIFYQVIIRIQFNIQASVKITEQYTMTTVEEIIKNLLLQKKRKMSEKCIIKITEAQN